MKFIISNWDNLSFVVGLSALRVSIQVPFVISAHMASKKMLARGHLTIVHLALHNV